MKITSQNSDSRRSAYAWISAGLLMALLFAASAITASPEETAAPVPDSHSGSSSISSSSTDVAALSEVLPKALPELVPASWVCTEVCSCESFVTPPTTRVGATCLRARQNAAAAARAIAICPSSSSGACGPTTHSVAPCQTLSTGGYSATAVATYYCNVCEEDCIDVP